MGTLSFRAEQYDRALALLNEFLRIREDSKTQNDPDYVNVSIMVGNIHKMKGNEEEAKRCWTAAYKVFQDLGMAENNPQIAAVLNTLVADPNAKDPSKQEDQGVTKSSSRSKSKNALRTFTKTTKKVTKKGIALATKGIQAKSIIKKGQQL